MSNDLPIYSIKIAGEAGQGIKSSSLNFAYYLNKIGFYIYNYLEYPSLIRGGHNVSQIVFSQKPVRSALKTINALIALDQASLNIHLPEITSQGLVIFDSESDFTVSVPHEASLIPVPLKRLSREAEVGDIGQNTVALGVLIYLCGGEVSLFNDLITKQFSKKPEFITTNQKAFKSGFDYASQNFANLRQNIFISDSKNSNKLLYDGNETVGLGAISGGLDFAAIYPMSPISNLLHFLAKNKEKYGYIYKQVEDEISAINMSIGASYAGARCLTATSGGGFALMSEALGLAGITETPIVIIEGMRGGPATGLPTWNEQGDLRFVLHAHQGDFPRIVLLPGDAEESFYATHKALNLAAKYQCPVIVLIDKNICDHTQSIDRLDNSTLSIDHGQITTQIDAGYERYKDTPSGISSRALPGSGNFFITNSDEHTSQGFSTEEISDRNTQHKKRLRKLYNFDSTDATKPILYGPENADITIVGWGSTKGAILDALEKLPNVNFLQITQVSPFPVNEVTSILSKSKYLLNIENNSTAQMAGLIREKTGIEIKDMYLKNDGRPFFSEDIINRVNQVLIK